MHPIFEQLKLVLGYYEVPPARKKDLQNIITEVVRRVSGFFGEPAWSEFQDAGEVMDYGSTMFKDHELSYYEYMIFRRRKGGSDADVAPDL